MNEFSDFFPFYTKVGRDYTKWEKKKKYINVYSEFWDTLNILPAKVV